MRHIALGLGILAFHVSTAHAADHGHMALQIKTPRQGCENLQLKFVDSEGKAFSPNGNSVISSDIAKKERKNTFTDIHKFHVKPGRHTMTGIKCQNFKKGIETTINFVAPPKAKLPSWVTTSNLVFDMKVDETIYLGALDFVKFSRDQSWPLALDRSQQAVDAGRLDAGTFTKQFVTLNVDFEAGNKAVSQMRDTASKIETMGLGSQPQAASAEIPPSGGKGEIAVHYKGSRCEKLRLKFKNMDDPDQKPVSIKVKGSYDNGIGFGTKKVPSGRYQFSASECTYGPRITTASAIAKSFVNVYPGEIAYAGEIRQNNKIDIDLNRKIGTKYRYSFNNDKFGAAKAELKKSDKLVDRSATMTDTAQLFVSGMQNSMNRRNAKLGGVISAYEAMIAEYPDDIIPGYSGD